MIAVNTALLKCYVLTKNSRKLSEHVQLPAPLCPCDVLDCAEFLLHHDKHDDAVSLYQSHGRHRDALQLLKDIGENDDVGGDGMRSTVEYLQRLGAKDEELVCEFSVWILKKDQRAGLSIFTGTDSSIAQDAAGEDTGIAPTRVREHLRQHSPRCVRGYLEHVVSRGNTSEQLHNELITLYLQQLNDLEATMGDQPTPEYQDTRTKLFGVLRDSKYYNAAMLLENSSFNVQNMPEERALLLSRVGEHVQALHIFVHRMGEERKAEDYCASVYHSGDDNCDDVYLALLKVYLVPQDPYRPRIEAAMRVLASHNDKMDTSKVLDMLPPETTVSDLRQFLVASIRSVNSKKRNGQVVKHIRKGENIASKKARAEAKYISATRFKTRGDWQNALQHFERAAEIFGEVYGESHIVTRETKAQALFCHGGLYKNQRDDHSAANYYEQSADLFAETIGEDHGFTLLARREYESVS